MDLITLQNEYLTVDIAPRGAELMSVRSAGTEYLWQGDPAVWSGRAPLLFPICGALLNDRYTWKGSTYTLPKHGFAMHEIFTPRRLSNTEAIFTLQDNERTRCGYPFAFLLSVTYQLQKNRLTVTYTVENNGAHTMYFNLGAHEAYATPDGIDHYTLVFDQEEQLDNTVLEGSYMTEGTERILNGRTLPLSADAFATSMVFAALRSRGVTLRHNETDWQVRVDFADFDHLLLWQVQGAPYLCIEPWGGLPDFVGHDSSIEHKRAVTALPAGKRYICAHSITFGKV